MATSNLTSNVVAADEKVAGSAGDGSPGFLDAKVDASTITVVSNQLVRAALTGDVTTVDNAATVVGGNADTVTTNANLTGVVTSTGNATAIADKALAIAKLADGTDGELITWDASGVIDTVAPGTAAQVLTSNGAGAAPTFQAAAGGGDLTLISTTTGTGQNTGNIAIEQDKLYFVELDFDHPQTGGLRPNLRVNSLSSGNYTNIWDDVNISTAVETLNVDNANQDSIKMTNDINIDA
jgi:hypothetical protein